VAHPATQPAATIPDHVLIEPIASGAYGEVWLARNAVGTLRAVKIVRRDRHATAESFEREFKGLQKFEPVSRSHDGLVDILTLGLLPEGAGFYYVMELADQARPGPHLVAADVRGLTSFPPTNPSHGSERESEPPDVGCYEARTLRADLKARGALPAEDVIALGLELTAALAHLHAHGLVHRDVKPSNILFIGGESKLADAGLVAAVDDARSLVGTAGYIAPEGPQGQCLAVSK
jgi:serine/threonine protein kinase